MLTPPLDARDPKTLLREAQSLASSIRYVQPALILRSSIPLSHFGFGLHFKALRVSFSKPSSNRLDFAAYPQAPRSIEAQRVP